MKLSEARILIFLNTVDERYKFAKEISYKLNMDYGYVLRMLGLLKFKGQIIDFRRENKVFYSLTKLAQVEEAKKVHMTKKKKTNRE